MIDQQKISVEEITLDEGREKSPSQTLTFIHQGNRTEIYLATGPTWDNAVPTVGTHNVEKRLLPFADVSTERHSLFREAIMQRLGAGPGVVPVNSPCPGQLAEEEMRSLTRNYVEGHTLKEFRLKASPSAQTSLKLIASLLEILARLHALKDEQGRTLGFVHRDVTPGNVIIDSNSGVWLNDFGLALVGDELPLAADETLQGTRRFLAPELVNGEQPSSASDVYQAMLLGAYLLDPERSEPPLALEARAAWARALLKPFIATEALAENPERRPSAHNLALILRELATR